MDDVWGRERERERGDKWLERVKRNERREEEEEEEGETSGGRGRRKEKGPRYPISGWAEYISEDIEFYTRRICHEYIKEVHLVLLLVKLESTQSSKRHYRTATVLVHSWGLWSVS